MPVKTRVCRRCGHAVHESPPVKVAITTGEGWSVNTRRLIVCRGCDEDFEGWLVKPHRVHHDGPGGAPADTVVASMALATAEDDPGCVPGAGLEAGIP
jgi:hypothetical protein